MYETGDREVAAVARVVRRGEVFRYGDSRRAKHIDTRYGVDGSGRIATADYTVVKDRMDNPAPAKP